MAKQVEAFFCHKMTSGWSDMNINYFQAAFEFSTFEISRNYKSCIQKRIELHLEMSNDKINYNKLLIYKATQILVESFKH